MIATENNLTSADEKLHILQSALYIQLRKPEGVGIILVRTIRG
ncbi:hypothetical protein [Methylotuvimicrobium sp.]